MSVALATSWHVSEVKNQFSASVSGLLGLNQVQTKCKGCGHQAAALTAQGAGATSREVPGQEAGLVKQGPPLLSGTHGARGRLPVAMKLSEHRSHFLLEGSSAWHLPKSFLPAC